MPSPDNQSTETQTQPNTGEPKEQLLILLLFDPDLCNIDFEKEATQKKAKEIAKEERIKTFLTNNKAKFNIAINQVLDKIKQKHQNHEIDIYATFAHKLNQEIEIIPAKLNYCPVKHNNIQNEFYELSDPKKVAKGRGRKIDYLVSLWDGIEDGADGGMGHLISRWVNAGYVPGESAGVNKKRNYIQILATVPDNSFPIARYYAAEDDLKCTFETAFNEVEHPIAKKEFPKNLRMLGFLWSNFKGWIILLLFLLVSLILNYYNNNPDPTWAITASSSVIIFFSCFILWVNFNTARTLLLRFIFPIILVIGTIGLGAYGFKTFHNNASSTSGNQNAKGMDLGDAFFAAANLITLNSSVLYDKDLHKKPNSALITARLLGGFLASYAFLLAFSFAAGRQNMDRLRFWWYRLTKNKKSIMPFCVVMGNGEMAIKLAIDLDRQKRRVVFFDNGQNPTHIEILDTRKVWYFNGHITYNQDLQKTYFWNAEEVYVISESDEENFRAAQELDEIYYDQMGKSYEGSRWYIHLRDRRKRELINQFSGHPVTSFSIEQNTARRLLSRFPVDRFRKTHDEYQKEGSSLIVIFGFNELARELALTCLRLGHFDKEKTTKVIVYYREEDKSQIKQFKKTYPALFKKAKPFHTDQEGACSVQDYTFFQHNEEVLTFHPLPMSETDLCNKDWSLYNYIAHDRITTLYACLPSGIESAAILGSILPRLEWIKQGKNNTQSKQCDIQVFCHYNFPDEKEEIYVETKLNRVALSIPVFFFGNQLRECTRNAIIGGLDYHAKEIAFLYDVLYKYDEIETLKGKNLFPNTQKSSLKEIPRAKIYFEELALVKQDEEKLKDYNKALNEQWQKLSENHRESNRQAADHALIKNRISGLKKFVKKSQNVLGDPEANQEAAATTFFEKLSSENIPDFSEIEHRR